MGPHAKKRKLAAPVEEITFNPEQRQEFLTGFRKRKQARVRHAQQVAEKRAREERVYDRKMIREERKAEYQRAFQEHRKQMDLLNKESDDDDNAEDNGSDGDQDEEWEGFAEPPPVDYEAEYVDEDKYTTVTVEEMDPSREGLLEYGREEQSGDEAEQEEGKQTQGTSEPDASKAAAVIKKKQNADKPKKKKKKFRYESKEDRKLNHAKQKLSKAKRAKSRRDQ